MSILLPLLSLNKMVIKWLGGKTLGVRALILKNEQILLIKHTYIKGWYFPGGGVNRGESADRAVCREAFEEAGVYVKGNPRQLGLFQNKTFWMDDHVMLYAVDHFEIGEKKPCFEIKEVKWFKLSELPEDITPSTRKHLEEFIKGDYSSVW